MVCFLAGGVAINNLLFADGELKFFSDDHPSGRIGVIRREEFGDPDGGKLQTMIMARRSQPPDGPWPLRATPEERLRRAAGPFRHAPARAQLPL